MTSGAFDPVRAVIAYHELSKHRLPNRYARSLGYLDWDTQPNPFRLYDGAERLALAREGFADGPTLDTIYDVARVGEPAPVDGQSVAQLLFDSLALSAWKQLQDKQWSLRCNPSSGNLHPTEAYLITGPIAGLSDAPMVSHYTPLLHALERRAALPESTWAKLIGDGEGLLIGLSSIPWREAWKYGERSYRYCQHDVGHAIAGLAYAAAVLGWQVRMLPQYDDAAVARMLGLDASGPEPEHPDLLVFVGPRVPSRSIAPEASLDLEFIGTPNLLSESHHPWPVVEDVARASARVGPVSIAKPPMPDKPEPSASGANARQVLRSRRSAVEMDGTTSLSRATFLRMLARTVPCAEQIPFASLLGRPRVHLLVFVHRVDELEPGLYLLLRDPSRQPFIATQIHAGFGWTPVDTGELDLPLFQLECADTRQAAALISCRQAIAADGAFACAMLAEFEPTLVEHGAWMYRHLHWEAGAIGQVLYLEAEAAGVRATGIGCFFDDAVAELLGLGDRSLTSLYHFTVGGPVDDPRLRTVDAYHHL